jgi:hypothetical protein
MEPLTTDELNGLYWTRSNGEYGLALGYALGYVAATGHTLTHQLWDAVYSTVSAGHPLDFTGAKSAIDAYFA